jgi:multiple sugar transport system ATP-binding protein
MAGVRLQHLVKRFGEGSTAVAGLSLDVQDGEFLVLVGPSGCGKTTALRMIAGLETPTMGRILIGEQDVTDLLPGDRDVAMVFQNYALYPHFTVQENIEFPLRMRKVVAAERGRRAREVAESLGIDAYLHRKPAELSGGQRQRVALARALVREPSVFLFDEPLSNLDAQVRAATRAELVRLHRRLGITIIHVTHDQVEAMSMAQRVAVMHEGRLEQCAPPMEVYGTPATLFTAQFVGTPLVNSIPGRVEGSGSRQQFTGPITLAVHATPGDATLAVRPEHLRLGAADGAASATVVLVEPLGAETIVHLALADGTELRARVPGYATLTAGTVVPVSVDATHALVFDVAGRLSGRGRA